MGLESSFNRILDIISLTATIQGTIGAIMTELRDDGPTSEFGERGPKVTPITSAASFGESSILKEDTPKHGRSLSWISEFRQLDENRDNYKQAIKPLWRVQTWGERQDRIQAGIDAAAKLLGPDLDDAAKNYRDDFRLGMNSVRGRTAVVISAALANAWMVSHITAAGEHNTEEKPDTVISGPVVAGVETTACENQGMGKSEIICDFADGEELVGSVGKTSRGVYVSATTAHGATDQVEANAQEKLGPTDFLRAPIVDKKSHKDTGRSLYVKANDPENPHSSHITASISKAPTHPSTTEGH